MRRTSQVAMLRTLPRGGWPPVVSNLIMLRPARIPCHGLHHLAGDVPPLSPRPCRFLAQHAPLLHPLEES